MQMPDVSSFDSLGRNNDKKAIEIEVEAPEGAPRYSGLTFSDIKVAPSPEWLQKALKSIGLRPINNIVDITNFVLLKQVSRFMHIDRDKIEGDKVVVKYAKAERGLQHLTEWRERALTRRC